jgi:hypothetical protein
MTLSTPTLTSDTHRPYLSPLPPYDDRHERYDVLLQSIRDRFGYLTTGPTDGASPPSIFTTDATGLFDLFLASLPAERRQHYNCHACRRFVDRFGGLVLIQSSGAQTPLFWGPHQVPDFFQNAVYAMRQAVDKARVTGVFLSSDLAWGTPQNRDKNHPTDGTAGVWHHLAVVPPKALVFKHSLLSADQVMAEKLQDFGILQRGLAEFTVDTVRHAHTLLTTGQLYRSEKCIGVAAWLLALHESLGSTKNERLREQLVWRAVATAPAGFCHVRSTMIGTLLEDLAAGLPFADVKAKFDAKMSPVKYQRPTAAPTVGNIRQAEEIIAKLGAASALQRRFARLDDVLPHAIWTPKPKSTNGAQGTSGGVFSHLLPTAEKPSTVMVNAPPVVMTWEKFRRTVLPTAEAIDFFVPFGNASYHALVTAADPESVPLVQWDRPEKRNPVSWYTYQNGSAAPRWNLSTQVYCPVTAIVLGPYQWENETAYPNHARRAFFLLQGARDLDYRQGAGLFGELLKSELEPIKPTIESFVRTATIQGATEASACGVPVVAGQKADIQVRVASRGTLVVYRIDRWD